MVDKIIVKKERFFKIYFDLSTLLKILGYLTIIIFIWYILDQKYIIVYLTHPRSKNIGYFFTILVSIMLMLFLVSCGFVFELTSKKWKIIIFIFILWLIYEGLTNIGFGFRFRRNYGLLDYEYYESNSKHGIRFFIFNFYCLFVWIYIISLFFEREKK